MNYGQLQIEQPLGKLGIRVNFTLNEEGLIVFYRQCIATFELSSKIKNYLKKRFAKKCPILIIKGKNI